MHPSILFHSILFYQVFWSRMNVVKVLRACEKALLWNETVYLYKVRFVYLCLDISCFVLLSQSLCTLL